MNPAPTRTLIAAAVGIVLLSAGCSGGATGTATPATTAGATDSTSEIIGSSAAGSALSGIKPCDLLTSSEVGGLGLAYPGEADEVGNADTCTWTVSGNGGLIAAIRPEQGIDDADYAGDPTSPVHLGTLTGVKIESPNGGKGTCHVVIRVSDSASVQVIAHLKASSTDTAAACQRATKAAELIAPKLP